MLRQAGARRAFTGEYTDTETKGVYHRRACGAKLFELTKFQGNCGWPSFDDAIPGTITYIEDRSHRHGPHRGALRPL